MSVPLAQARQVFAGRKRVWRLGFRVGDKVSSKEECMGEHVGPGVGVIVRTEFWFENVYKYKCVSVCLCVCV